ncbi:MAG: hypothetical protein HOA66_00620 [Candidatus Marinimicrobia bacterium]|nr:hypothetical protein [Candidatus Neomarinimicrobiota bacterium]
MSFRNVFILLSVLSIVFSQAMYIESSNNHLGFKGIFDQYKFTSDVTKSEVGFSSKIVFEEYFTKGLSSNNLKLIDLEIGFLNTYYRVRDDDSFDEDTRSYFLNIGYHIKYPSYVNIAITSNFTFMKYNSVLFEGIAWEDSRASNELGLEIYKTILNIYQFRIIPFIGIKQIAFKEKGDEIFGNSIYDDFSKSLITYGFGYVSNNVFVESRISKYKKGNEFSINIGFYLPID